MKKIIAIQEFIIDKYLAFPIYIDIIIVSSLWIGSKKINLTHFVLVDKSNQINILSNIIGTDVSLAGFILAALTIIVTFKSNLKAKGIKESNTPLEMILTSKHYIGIVNVFKQAIIEFTLCFIFLFLIWTVSDNLTIRTINRAVVTGIIITSASILRSLFVLFTILKLDNKT